MGIESVVRQFRIDQIQGGWLTIPARELSQALSSAIRMPCHHLQSSEGAVLFRTQSWKERTFTLAAALRSAGYEGGHRAHHRSPR